jgi:hypothetical protein
MLLLLLGGEKVVKGEKVKGEKGRAAAKNIATGAKGIATGAKGIATGTKGIATGAKTTSRLTDDKKNLFFGFWFFVLFCFVLFCFVLFWFGLGLFRIVLNFALVM